MKIKNFLSILLISLILSGCISFTNPSPSLVVPDQPSYDGNEQNSGVLYQISTGGYVITANARDRYNSFIEQYGSKLNLIKDYGLTPVYIATDEAIENFAKMNLWDKNKDVLDPEDITKSKKKHWFQFWKSN